jgi:hypothetical protein
LPYKKDAAKQRPSKKRKTKAERNAERQGGRDALLATLHVPPDNERHEVVGADPGKRNLLHLTNESAPDGYNDGEERAQDSRLATLNYTFGQRLHESGAAKRAKWQEQRMRPDARGAQEALAEYDSRVTGLEHFQGYLGARFRAQSILSAQYGKVHQRVVRWHNWRDRRASEDRFAQRVVHTFGTDAVIAYGNASGFHALAGLPSSPTQGLRARLRAKAHLGLQVVPVPEAYTTLTCSRCGATLKEDPTRARYTDAGRLVAPRGIRRCHSANCGGLRWNRDHNAAINIRANLLHRLQNGRWLFGPRRDTALVGGDTPDDGVLAAERDALLRRNHNNLPAGMSPLASTAPVLHLRESQNLVVRLFFPPTFPIPLFFCG